MCLHVYEEETAKLKETHPRFIKCWKQLKVEPHGGVISPYYSNCKWNPGWTSAINRQQPVASMVWGQNIDGLEIHGGVIHVFRNEKHNLGADQRLFPLVPAYGFHEDFVAVGTDGRGPAACYKKIYITKAAWRRVVHPIIDHGLQFVISNWPMSVNNNFHIGS